MSQSSETWHDNAPADVLFGHLKQLDQKEARINRAVLTCIEVPFPAPELDFVTIGSRVRCDIAGDQFLLDVVGNIPVDGSPEDETEKGSIDAPLPRSLLGKRVGESAIAELSPGRSITIKITSLDQVAQKDLHVNKAKVPNLQN